MRSPVWLVKKGRPGSLMVFVLSKLLALFSLQRGFVSTRAALETTHTGGLLLFQVPKAHYEGGGTIYVPTADVVDLGMFPLLLRSV
jgi:hypothetical protein